MRPGEPTKSSGAGPIIAVTPISVRMADKEVVGNGVSELQVARSRIPSTRRVMTLREVTWDRVDLVANRMKAMSEDLLEEIRLSSARFSKGLAVRPM
jgi:hypothetical protein